MTTYATPFSGSEINPPNPNAGIQTIGNIVNLAGGIQGITQAAQMNPIAVQEANLKLQQEQAQTQSINQTNTERKWQVNALQQGMLQMNADGTPNTGYSKNDLYKAGDPLLGQDGKPVVSGDGQAVTADAGGMVGKPKPGAQTFAQKVMTNMPQTGASLLQTLSDSTTKTNQANASALALKSNQLKELGGVFASANTPGASAMDIREAGQNWLTTQDPATQAALSSQIGPLTDQMEHQIGQAAKVAGSDPKAQEAARNAVVQSFVGRLNALSTTKEVQETQKGQIATMGAAPGIQLATGAATPRGSVAVPAAEQPGVDLSGNPIATYIAPSGRATARQIQAGAGPSAPATGAGGGAAAVPVLPQNRAQAALAMDNPTAIKAVRDQGDAAPNNRTINDKILALSSNTNTGPGTERWQNILGGLSAAWGGTEQVNNYQEMGKFLEKNAIANMQAMGGTGSDARLDAAVKANGGTSFNRGALQDVTKYNNATNTALMGFRSGMDQAVGLDNAHPEAMPQFRSDWKNNLDVNVFLAFRLQS